MSDEPAESSPAAASPTQPEGAPAAGAAAAVPPEVLKSAFNAFKKRWKLTRLDYESRIGRGPLSAGNRSAIVGIEPPKEFPRAVWEELVKQGRIKAAGKGLYALP